MITFPSWVEGPRNRPDEDELARRRLRYLVMRASVECTESGSVASLADLCGVERQNIHAAIRDGKASRSIALKIEHACGRNIVKREWLMFPLEIHEMTA